MNEITIQPPDATEITEANAQTTALIAEFGAVQITTQDQYRAAAELLRDAATLLQKIAKACEPTIKAAHAAHKAATQMRAELCAPIDDAVAILKANMAEFQRAEKLREERERAEAERIRREFEAEQRRQREEADRLMREAEEAAAKADAAPDGSFEAYAANYAAEKIIEQANAAQDAIEQAAECVPYIPVQEAAKAKGVASVTVYKWRIVDKAKIPQQFWTLNEKAIDAFVRVAKSTTDIPGIEVYAEESIRVSAR